MDFLDKKNWLKNVDSWTKIDFWNSVLSNWKNIRFNTSGIDSFIKCPIGLGCQVGAVLAAWVDVNLGQGSSTRKKNFGQT